MNEILQEQAQELVERLGKFLEKDNLIYDDEDDTCLIHFDETNLVTLTLFEKGDVIMIDECITTLSLAEQEDRKELVEKMLEANIFWIQTKGATLSMYRESGTVIIARQLPLYRQNGVMIDTQSLGLAIRDLVSVATEWRALLETGEPDVSLLQKMNSDENDLQDISDEQVINNTLLSNPQDLA